MINKILKIHFNFDMTEFLIRMIATIYIRTVFIPENKNNREQNLIFPFHHGDIKEIPEDLYIMINVQLRER